jgi:branched-chain amino acid transport system ATP-binding protein
LERGQIKFKGESHTLLEHPELLRSIFIDPTMKVSERIQTANESDSRKVFEAEFVTKHFGGIMAVSEVSLDISSGEIHGIIGANGAGKTTLFDMCSGFIKPDRGRFRLDGIDITHMSATKRAALGLGRVFQHAQLFPALTVFETVALAHERFIFPKEPISASLRLPAVVKIERQIKESVEYLLDLFHLNDFRNTFISELSTGTRRIVELACSMAHRPLVLLLDEPSSGLAQKECESLVDLLFKVSQQTDAALLIIEHDIPLISAVASQLTCLHLGEIIANGKPESVLSEKNVIESYLGSDQIAIDRSNSS